MPNNDINLGMGIEFDDSTLNQLKAIVDAVKNIEKETKDLVKSFSGVTEKAKETVKESEKHKQQIEDIRKKAGELQQVTTTINNGVTKTTEAYKNAAGEVSRINALQKENSNEIKTSATYNQKNLEIYNGLREQISQARENAGELLKSHKNINKDGYTLISTYKEINGQKTKIIEKFNKENQLIGGSVSQTQVQRNLLKDIGGNLAHNVTKMLEWATAATLIYGGIRVLQKSFKTMIQLETEAVNIAKVLPETIRIGDLERDAASLGKRFGESVLEIEKAMQSWARQYKNASDIARMTEASMLAATATDISFAGSVKYLSAIMAEWNFTTSQSTHVVNILNEASNNFRVTAEELATGLAKTGSGARAVGLEFEELTGIITTGIQALGLSGEEMGTMWTRVMSRIKGNKDARSAFEGLGIDTSGTMSQMLNELMVRWDGLSKNMKTNFAITVAGTHHWSKFIGIMDNYNTVIDATTKAYLSQNSAQDEVERALGTLEKQIKQLNAAWQEIVIKGKPFLDVAKSFVGVAKTIVDGMGQIKSAAQLAGIAILAVGSALALISANVPTLAALAGVATVLGVSFYEAGKHTKGLKDNLQETIDKFEDYKKQATDTQNITRGIGNLAGKYEVLSRAIEQAKAKGEDTAKLEEKMILVSDNLTEALDLGNQKYETRLKMDESLASFARRRIKEMQDIANEEKKLQKQMLQTEITKVGSLAMGKSRVYQQNIDSYVKERMDKARKGLETSWVAKLFGTGPVDWDKMENMYRQSAIKKYQKEAEDIEALNAHFRKLQKQYKEIVIEDIGKDVEENFSLGDTPKISRKFTTFTQEQLKEIIAASKKIQDELIAQDKEIEQTMFEYIMVTPEGIKIEEFELDSTVLGYVEGVFKSISDLTGKTIELKGSFLEAAAVGDSAWANFLETLREFPSVMNDINKMENIFLSDINKMEDLKKTALAQKADLKLEEIKTRVKIEEARTSGLQENSTQMKLLTDYLKVVTDSISSLDDTVNKATERQELLAKVLGTLGLAKGVIAGLESSKSGVTRAQEAYDEAKAQAVISGFKFEGTKQEESLKQEIINSYMAYYNAYSEAMQEIKNLQTELDTSSPEFQKAFDQLQAVLKLTEKEMAEIMKAIAGIKGDGNSKNFQKKFDLLKTTMSSFGNSLSEVDGWVGVLGESLVDLANSLKMAANGTIDFMASLEAMVISYVIKFVSGFIRALADVFSPKEKKQYNKWQDTEFMNAELLKDFGNFDQNKEKLKKLYDELAALTTEMLYAPFWELKKIKKEINKVAGEIENLENKLEVTWGKVKDAFGVGISDIVNALGSAFEASNYYEFLRGWGTNLEGMTRDALIKGFLASNSGIYTKLSDTIAKATLEGTLTSESVLAIRQAGQELSSKMRILYQSLNLVDMISPGTSGGSSGGGSYTAGTSVPITYNNYISVNSLAFCGNEDEARSLAQMIGRYLKEDAGRI